MFARSICSISSVRSCESVGTCGGLHGDFAEVHRAEEARNDMTTETEVKIRVDEKSLGGIRQRLLEMGFRQEAERAREENILMDYSNRSLRNAGSALRLRKYGAQRLLTFKGPRKEDTHLKSREEIETEIGDLAGMRKILEALGMTVCFEYGKYREKLRLEGDRDNLEVCIDETPVGCFIEIEGSGADIEQLALDLGWTQDHFINKNYIDLYTEQGS